MGNVETARSLARAAHSNAGYGYSQTSDTAVQYVADAVGQLANAVVKLAEAVADLERKRR